MSQQPAQSELDRLVDVAQRAEPPGLSPFEARRQVRLAVSRAEAVTPARARLGLLAVAAAAAALMLLVLSRLSPAGTSVEVADNDRPLRIGLRTGDRVVAAPGTRLEIVAQAPARRRVKLTRGAALFDVARLGANQDFEVETAQAVVRVLGTVFSVEVIGGRTVVRVYEGRVYVDSQVLGINDIWVSEGRAPIAPTPALVAEARSAVDARSLVQLQPSPKSSATPAVISWVAPVPATSIVKPERVSSASGPTLEDARAWLLRGETERALEAARTRADRHAEPWTLLEADALRALGQFEQATVRYTELALRSSGPPRIEAGYAAASLSLHALHDALGCLRVLDQLSLDTEPSELRERASVLRVDALVSLGRTADARFYARRYLMREPETRTSQRMRALLR